MTPFGADERKMLHAERGICDAGGHALGGVVVHIAQRDYQALPFVSSANPYYDDRSAPTIGRRRIAPRRSAGGRLRLEPAADVHVGPRRVADRARSTSSGCTSRATPFWIDARRREPARITCTSRRTARASTRSAIRRRRCSSMRRGWPKSSPSTAVLFVAHPGRRARRTARSRGAAGAAARAVPRDPHELLSQALPLLRPRGRRPGAAVRAGVRRLHDGEVPRRRRVRSRERRHRRAPRARGTRAALRPEQPPRRRPTT